MGGVGKQAFAKNRQVFPSSDSLSTVLPELSTVWDEKVNFLYLTLPPYLGVTF
jgi:hypothetical protein